MRGKNVNRLLVAAGVAAVALVGLSASTYATPQRGQNSKEEQKKQRDQQKQEQAQAKQRQQALINQQQQRLTQYRDHLNQQQRAARPQSAQLQQQNRREQYAVQQQYVAHLHEQQVTVQRQRPATYSRDPYFSAPPAYRYSRGGRSYEVNEGGVNLLKQAVNYGYDQGYRFGQADRQDRSPFNCENSFAYQDANYGYNGFYVDRDDYNFYFREGFRRGYEDGYRRQTQFGMYVNGRATILDAVLGSVFNFQVIVR